MQVQLNSNGNFQKEDIHNAGKHFSLCGWRERTFEEGRPSVQASDLLAVLHLEHGRMSLHFALESLHGMHADGTFLFLIRLDSKFWMLRDIGS
jgi:hypothetical protein